MTNLVAFSGHVLLYLTVHVDGLADYTALLQ